MAVDHSLLAQIRANANKAYGSQRMHPGNTIDPVFRIPFKSILLNLATYGGAPMGRMIRLWGGKSSCKSMTAWELGKMGQDLRTEQFPDGMNIAYYNIEGAYDPVYVRDILGVNIDEGKLEIVESGLIEDVSRDLDSLLKAVNIHIIDSASFAQSVHSWDAPNESQQPGFDAKAWKNAYRSAEKWMDKNENIIIIIDQIRTDFKTGAEKAAGGHVADHASSMSLHHRRGKKLYRVGDNLVYQRPQKGNDELTGGHRIDGYEVEVEVEKSRVCRPFGKALMRFDIDRLEFEQPFELIKAGIFLGVIEKNGAWYKIPTQEKPINGEKNLGEAIESNPFLVKMIWDASDDYCKNRVYAR